VSGDPFKDVRERRAKITPAPWRWKAGDSPGGPWGRVWAGESDDDGVVATTYSPNADAEFIAHAPADIDRLLAENERLREALRDRDTFIDQYGHRAKYDEYRAICAALAAPSETDA
jgi:hypothetical protein